jgi:hypothetical protein
MKLKAAVELMKAGSISTFVVIAAGFEDMNQKLRPINLAFDDCFPKLYDRFFKLCT